MPTTDQLISRLKEVAGKAAFVKDRGKLDAYALDGKRPKVIVSPKTVDEVSKIVAYANQEHLALVPMGSGTKTGMGGIPKMMDIVLLTTRLNRITDCDIENLTLTAESGIFLNQVQRHLAKEGKGYFLPLDPPFTDKATLGGVVATNSSGPNDCSMGRLGI
jgi:FAD/FMN-containing dehydrogenase